MLDFRQSIALEERADAHSSVETCICSQCTYQDQQEAEHLSAARQGLYEPEQYSPAPGYTDAQLARLGRIALGSSGSEQDAIELGKIYVGHPYY
jgi:hypothetical protein